MRMVDIIEKKRNGLVLTNEEISFFINGYINNEIPEYQVSALLMAIYFKGMNKEEIACLTDKMLHSGDIIDLSAIKGIKADKHSTGGVGDKTSLVVGPLVASCGVKLAKMSGRGLGHTGGTLDKMESIPGLRINLSDEEFINQVNKIGIAIVGQTAQLVPADKKLYALRDVTATVESIPLIASSIMSKKLASGSDTILLDVKVGSGAFMKNLDQARELARTMVEIGKSFNKDTRAELTDMDQPLGLAVGNSLEVLEAINTLHGKGPKDFTELCMDASMHILLQAKVCKTEEEAIKLLNEKISSGEAFEKFKQFVKAQGGDLDYIDHIKDRIHVNHIIEIHSKGEGYVNKIDALGIGEYAMRLGAGREVLEDTIDHDAGIVLNKKIGDYVNKNDVLCYVYTNKDNYEDIIKGLDDLFVLKPTKLEGHKIIYEVIS